MSKRRIGTNGLAVVLLGWFWTVNVLACETAPVYAVGASLAGLLDPGALLVATTMECGQQLKPGDLVLVPPLDRSGAPAAGLPSVKVVGALSGDRISVADGDVLVNGKPLVVGGAKLRAPRAWREKKQISVPKESVMVFSSGQAPAPGMDSRAFGPVSLGVIMATAVPAGDVDGPAIATYRLEKVLAEPALHEYLANRSQAIKERSSERSKALWAIAQVVDEVREVSADDSVMVTALDDLRTQVNTKVQQVLSESVSAAEGIMDEVRQAALVAAHDLAKQDGYAAIIEGDLAIQGPVDDVSEAVAQLVLEVVTEQRGPNNERVAD